MTKYVFAAVDIPESQQEYEKVKSELWLTETSFWNENKYLQDHHLKDYVVSDLLYDLGFSEAQESIWESPYSAEETKRILELEEFFVYDEELFKELTSNPTMFFP